MKCIDVLVVDDEKDIYVSTKLALKLLEFEGIKANVYYSESASQAMAILEEKDFQLMFLDIIMESVNAGYKVIDYVKQHQKEAMRIYIRSGLPGAVPDQYVDLMSSIDGYISKTECTMAKLHDIVKSIA
jgi:CheY-like chemotaxis protein